MGRRFPGLLLRRTAYALVFLALTTHAQIATETTLEYEVKAAFLLNFAKFIEWPADAFPTPDSPMEICVLGDNPFGAVLDQTVEGESVDGRKVAVRRLKGVAAMKSCRIVFISRSEKDYQPAEVGHGVLIVGESPRFLARGGAIAFVVEDRHVRFDISRGALARNGLKPSSKLLRAARTVEK